MINGTVSMVLRYVRMESDERDGGRLERTVDVSMYFNVFNR